MSKESHTDNVKSPDQIRKTERDSMSNSMGDKTAYNFHSENKSLLYESNMFTSGPRKFQQTDN